MSDYETDIPTWSKRQADLLRRHAAGKHINLDEIDWQHIIEGLEAQGQSQGQSPSADRVPSLMREVYRTLSRITGPMPSERRDKKVPAMIPRVMEAQDIDEAAAEAAAVELLEATDRSLEAIARYGERIDARLAEIDAIRAKTRAR
jgi:Domain of unknown function DUF29